MKRRREWALVDIVIQSSSRPLFFFFFFFFLLLLRIITPVSLPSTSTSSSPLFFFPLFFPFPFPAYILFAIPSVSRGVGSRVYRIKCLVWEKATRSSRLGLSVACFAAHHLILCRLPPVCVYAALVFVHIATIHTVTLSPVSIVFSFSFFLFLFSVVRI